MPKPSVFSIVSFSICVLFSFAGCRGQEQATAATKKVPTEFADKILPLLEQYCNNCHAPGDMEGLEFLTAETAADVAKLRGVYAAVVEQMETQAMPPKDCDQPTKSEQKLVIDWIKKSLDLKPSDTDRIAQYVVEAYQDKKGNLWFGTMHNGAIRHDGKTLTYFSQKDGLPTNTVTSFAEDKDGNLWAGTHNGVCKFDGKTFQKLGIAEGLPAPTRPSAMAWASVQADKQGNLWVTVGDKIFRQNEKTFSEFNVPISKDKIESFSIVAGRVSLKLEDKTGNLWFGTDGNGAFKYDGKSFTHFTKQDGLCSNNVTSIIEDKKGNIWFTCIQSYQPKMTGDGGVCRYDGKAFTKFPGIEGLAGNDIYTIYQTRSGDIWIGATGVGAYHFAEDKFTLFNETDKPHWTRNFGVQDILEDRNGTLWFGFSGGLFRFNGKSFFNVTKNGPWKDLVSTMADAAAGGDAETEWIQPETVAGLTAVANGQLDQAIAILQKLKREHPDEVTIQEMKINEVGYQLVFTNRLDQAVEIFKLNTQLYPQAFNTFDSLGEAYLRKGDEPQAVENYEKSLELNPTNQTAIDELRKISARSRYENLIVAPKDWIEEVIIVPPSFAPSMSLKGMEHLRLPPEFRVPESKWFLSYLYAIELTEPSELTEEKIGSELLIYFRGLADGSINKEELAKFTIESKSLDKDRAKNEFVYELNWREPFVTTNPQKLNIRVKVLTGKNKHGVIFVCGSPQLYDSPVWIELLRIRTGFESAPAKTEK